MDLLKNVILFILWMTLVSASNKDYPPSTAIHERRDAIHQVGYNYPSWPSPEPSNNAQTRPAQSPPNNEHTTSTLDEFYRVSQDGTIEFRVALSDGQVNYQKIYNKEVNGSTIQVYDGYYSVRLDDGRYRSTYYRADEYGYQLLGFNVHESPPVEWRDYKKQ